MSTLSTKKYKQDGKTTYCYYSLYSYEDPLSAVQKIEAEAVGTPCPVQVKVRFPTTINKGEYIQLSMTAVIADKDKPKEFEFYTSGVIGRAPVPARLLDSSNNESVAASDGSGGSLAGKTFDIPVASFHICDFRGCDAFTDRDTYKGTYFESTNNPQNFNDRIATFGSNELIISKEGKYTGVAAITIPFANARLDFVTYFPVQIGELPGAVDKISRDAATTYCWVFNDGETPTDAVTQETYISIHTNTLCPGSMSLSLSTNTMEINEEFTIDFGMQLETARDPAMLVGEVSPIDAVLNPNTNVWSIVPVAIFGACLENADDKSKACSTYEGPTSRTTSITQFYDRNLTSGAVKYSAKHSFKEPGTYVLVSRVAMQTVDGNRLDMAMYSTVTVAIPAVKSGTTFLYIGLGIGLFILVVGLVFCILRKRRTRRQMKEIPFRTPMPPASVVNDRSSQYTATSSKFVTHRSPQMHNLPVAYPQYEDSSFYPAADQYKPQYRHKDSFTLDPYRRNSFNDIAEGESIDMTIRPSDASKFSFQTGYDDQSDWEYDTQSFRSEGQSEYSDVQRGTFHLNSGAMPIMEARQHQRGGSTNHHYVAGSVPRSTTSSEWTVRG